MVKNPSASAGDIEKQVPFLGQEDPGEKKMATYSSILAWKISRTGEPDGFMVDRVAKSWTRLKQLSTHTRLLQ